MPVKHLMRGSKGRPAPLGGGVSPLFPFFRRRRRREEKKSVFRGPRTPAGAAALCPPTRRTGICSISSARTIGDDSWMLFIWQIECLCFLIFCPMSYNAIGLRALEHTGEKHVRHTGTA